VRSDELPLFPLQSVLFPGGHLRMRICEPRHTDIIRWCTREARPFGACLLLDGSDTGERAAPAAIGTAARIVDFFTSADGLLGIEADGTERFHVCRTRVRDNGLIVARVERLPAATGVVQPQHALLVVLLENLLDRFGGPHANAARPLFDDAAWVGFRLAELLPFANGERQALLQCGDAHDRLDRIVHALPDLRA